jgi:hypothetical protein
MKLPQAQSAVISESKLVENLLNPTHQDNGGKAGFSLALGFSLENREEFATALRQFAAGTEIAEMVESPYGAKSVLDGWLHGRDNGQAMVRTIWIIDRGMNIPRLVTAYPAK